MLSLKSLAWSLLLLQPALASVGEDYLLKARTRHEARLSGLQDVAESTDTSSYRYKNSKTDPYFIKSFPDVSFNVGEIYGGSVPIDKSEPNRTLYFIFKPSTGPPVDEVTIWLNGGPGCSSLIGFLQENGPFLWQPGVAEPKKNPYAWNKMTNMLWVEQPVGTGFAQGEVTAKNEVDVAKDFVAFFKNWEQLFGISKYKIYITGESYAGRYVPYISAQMLDQNDTTYYDLTGAMVFDPCIGDCGIVQNVAPIYPFVLNNNDILNINDTALAEMESMSSKCGYTEFLNTYLTYPPPGHQPKLPPGFTHYSSCDVDDYFYNAVAYTNPCFDIYHITDYCPNQSDSLGGNPYFNRTDVKKAIHAPLNVDWSECSNIDVFKGGDSSPNSIQAVLPQVIEATQRVLVANGQWDALIPTNGTLLAIQNMTWGGKTGFQSMPSTPLVIPAIEHSPAQGVMGVIHNERGLQWAVTDQSGHMQPQYQPRVTWQYLSWLLGRISSL